MKLYKICIDNFRCFKQYEITFASNTTVLIGRNGVGKSSLIHAIRYALSFIFTNDKSMGDDFLSASNPELRVANISSHDFYKEKAADLPTADLNIHAEATFNKTELNWNIYKRSTSGSSLYPSKYNEAYKSFIKEYEETKQLPLLVYFSDSYPHKDSKLSIFANDSIKEQGNIIRNFGYYQWDEETASASVWKMRFINAQIKHLSIKEPGNSIKEEIDFIRERLKTFSKSLNEEYNDYYEIDTLFFTIDDKKSPELYIHLKNGKDISFANLPAGYKRLFSIVLDIAYRGFILNMGKPDEPQGIVIIDEIDLHLHPSLEQEVLQRLHTTFPLLQFIVSTHSPLLISNLKTERGENMVLQMTEGENTPRILPDIYGIDYNSSVSDFMNTPSTNEEISAVRSSILRLLRRGKIALANNKKLELKEMVSEERYNQIITDIEKNL